MDSSCTKMIGAVAFAAIAVLPPLGAIGSEPNVKVRFDVFEDSRVKEINHVDAEITNIRFSEGKLTLSFKVEVGER